MRFNAEKEEVLFTVAQNKAITLQSHVNPDSVITDIENIFKNKEDFYIFKSGDRADFLYQRSCVNDLSFNHFQIYNKSVYLCLKEIHSLISEACDILKINKKINNYYITSDYEQDLLEDYWYDTGGMGIPIFAGYWILESDPESYISVNSNNIYVKNGSLILFQASAKTEFKGISKAISFNIATISKIIGQYPQKWMPIILT